MKCILALTVLLGVANLAAAGNGDQNPKVWDALDQLRGKKPLTIPQIQELYVTAVAGQDYPLNSVIPPPSVDCHSQPIGFYADDSAQSKCQAFHRCDGNGDVTSYLCPNQSLFNQITLICDWWYNIDCSQSKKFITYSNSRLSGDDTLVLLDNQDVYDVLESTGAVLAAEPAPEQQKKPKKKTKAHQ